MCPKELASLKPAKEREMSEGKEGWKNREREEERQRDKDKTAFRGKVLWYYPLPERNCHVLT